MSKFIREHLDLVTPQVLLHHAMTAFMPVASTSGKIGKFAIGVNGCGMYVVHANDEIFEYALVQDAIDKYREVVTEALERKNQEPATQEASK